MSGWFKKARNIFAIMLTAVCALTFSGCNSEPEEEVPMKTVAVTDEEGNPVTDDKGEPVMTEVPLETIAVTDEEGNPVTDENGEQVYEYEALPEEEKTIYKVGFVYSGFVSDGATNGAFEVARAQIERSLGLETCYVENVLVSEFPEAVNTLKDDGCNIIVSCSQKYANSAYKENKSSTDTFFISFGEAGTGAHLASFGGELYQTANVCGLAAAHNTKSNVIGVIADPGEYNVYGIIDGFSLGVAELMSAKADIRVNWAWSNSKSEMKEALDDLVSQGCDVIMSYMESDYPVRYCADRNIKVIANCYNMPELAPDCYISGYFFNFSTHLVDVIRSIVNDNFNPEVYSGNIASGMVRLVNFGLNTEKGTEDICDKLYEYIKAGNARVFTGEIKNTDGQIMVEKGQSMTFDNILKVNWLVQSVRKTGSFTEITDNPVGSNFTIHKEFKDEETTKEN